MKKDYAEEVAGRLIEQLEQGTAPWQKPWQPGELRLPYNPTTGKEYRGMNSMWLAMQGQSDPRWMTYNQASAEGAQVKKGSKGTHIVYWKFSDEKKATDEQGNPILDPETGKQKTINVQLERPRSFTAVVFNASQIDGLPPLEARATRPEPERHARAEAILTNSGADIRHESGDRAFYRPSTDSITLPERNQFDTADNYYATALHELGHWTGHPSRFDRDLSHPFGSEGYAREELRAEIASLMVGERLDIGHDPGQHAAYVGSWIKALKEDPKEIFRAASDAEKIAGYVMDFEQEQMQTQTQSVQRQTTPEIAPEVAEALQRQHEIAVDDLSPLSSWQMMKAEAERHGYTAKIDFHPENPEPGEGAYEITYLDQQGQATGIRTELGGDGKLVTEHNGQRLSLYRSNDDESQPAALAMGIQLNEEYKQVAQQQAATPPQQLTAESWTLAHVQNATLERAMANATAEQVEQVQKVLDSMQPLGNDNPFWTRHELPYDVDALDAKLDTADRVLSAKQENVPASEHPSLSYQVTDRFGEVISEFETLPEAMRSFMDQPGVITESLRLSVLDTTDNTSSTLIGHDWIRDGSTHQYTYAVEELETYHVALKQLGRPDHDPTLPEVTAEFVEPSATTAVSVYLDYHRKKKEDLNAAREEAALDRLANLPSSQPDAPQGEPSQQTPPAYTVQSRRTVPKDAAQHAGENAVYVQLDDGRRAWGFGATGEAAEQSAVDRAQKVGLDADRAPTRTVLHEKPEKPMGDVTYLAVPYKEKDEAKAVAKASGFKLEWDKENKAWFAPAGADLSKMERWKADGPNVVNAAEPKAPIDQFKDALKAAGLTLPKGDVIDDGNMHRVPVDGDKGGATSGAYAYHKEGKTPGGFIQNYKTGEVVHWKPEGKTEEVNAADRARLATEAAAQRKERDTARQAAQGATAAAAQALWDEAPAATGDNAYCKAKGITNPVGLREVPEKATPKMEAHGIKIAKTAKEAKALREADPKNRVFKSGDLLIPGTDGEGKLWTLQSVNPYFKSFMKDGRKAGLFTVTGTDDPAKALKRDSDSPLVLAEGYATADTVSRLMGGKPVVVAFDSGNLDAVASGLRERHPSRPLLIAADNDHNAPKTLDANGKPKVNVGLVKAQETAKAHGGGVMAPQFKDGDKGSDWNDLAASRGDEAAREMLGEQMALAKRDAAITAERLTTLARTRDMEARNDPTTSKDDSAVAIERGKAAEVLAGAQSSLSEVRSMAADGMAGGSEGKTGAVGKNGKPGDTKNNGATRAPSSVRSPASVKAGLDRKTEAMHDRAKDERQEVMNHAQPGPLDGVSPGVSWKKLPEQVKQALIEDVKQGKDVALPKDAPAKLKQMAGHEPSPPQRSRSRGMDVGL